jgi:thiol:disulfide interchange protein DsbD
MGQDPFAPSNAAKVGSLGDDTSSDRLRFSVTVSPLRAKPGQTVRLRIEGKPKPGFHTYPLTQKSADPEQTESQLSKLTFQDSSDLKPLYPITETPPEFERVEGVGTFLEHRGPFAWIQDILVRPQALPGEKKLKAHVRAQVCDTSCVWTDHDLEATVEVLPGPAVALTADLKARQALNEPKVRIVPVPEESGSSGAAAGSADQAPPAGRGDSAAEGLAPFLLASMGAAVLMLFTPCVFPMIPITVSFFLKQSEKEHHNALASAGVYSLTIILVLALAVMVLGQVIINWANSAWVNLGLGLLLVFFALSLFGMYEIELPSGLARFTAARESQGGYAGAMFMALTFTITSFTCTGPFLGPLLVAVKESPLGFTERMLGALCYSAVFAAPFFFLALFPSLLKKLPKSGGWLNAVKVVMGFLELAAALKFLANTDLAWNPGNPMLFNYDTVLCAWIALAVCCGLYLLGVYRLPHDTLMENLGVGRMILSSIFFGLAFYMAPALWRVTPQGIIGRGLVAFLPLDTKAVPGNLTWHRDYEKAWAEAVGQNKLIFIDFTGQNCTNCRYNELNVFPVPSVRAALEQYVRVQLYTDFVPDAALSAQASQQQGQRNSELQSATVGDIANPLYAIVQPDNRQPFADAPGGKKRLSGDVINVRKGLISRDRVADFERFLRLGERSSLIPGASASTKASPGG